MDDFFRLLAINHTSVLENVDYALSIHEQFVFAWLPPGSSLCCCCWFCLSSLVAV
jgi:hypothetical protein